MNNLIVVQNVRGYIDEKGTAYLNLEDVARGLGFVETAKSGNEVVRWRTIRKYLLNLDIIATSCDGQGKENLPEFIPENIFYKLCMKANNETARKFQDLVCDEILPEIRKNGGYIVTNDEDDETTIMAKAVLLADKTIKNLKNKVIYLERDNQIKEQQIAEFKPIKDYVDTILSSDDTLTVTQIGADYGITGTALNKILHEQGLIRSVGGQWILYKEHMNKGYTRSKTVSKRKKDGTIKSIIHTYWTQKGRLKIHEILTSTGIKANQDKETEINS